MNWWKNAFFLWNLLEKVLRLERKQLQKPIRETFAPTPKTLENFLKKFFLLEINLCTLRNYFWQPCRKKIANGLKDSRWKSDKDKISCLVSKTSTIWRKVPPDLRIAVLETLTIKLAKSPFLCWKIENDEEIFFSAN